MCAVCLGQVADYVISNVNKFVTINKMINVGREIANNTKTKLDNNIKLTKLILIKARPFSL